MQPFMTLLIILLPILGGVLVPLLPFKNRKQMMWYVEILVLLTSGLAFLLLLRPPAEAFRAVRFFGNLSIAFSIDGMSRVFGGLVAALWPLATLYAFTYMEREKRETYFFMFYTMTFGVTLGIAFADNLLTMYFFYELLTLVTVPLVLHSLTREAVLAARKYLYYSLGGAAFAFLGLIFVIFYGSSTDFILGGVLDLAKIGDKTNALLLIYVMAFWGFGVKAAICPFNSWLPQAGVAPTPVTALLHAVAVVKAGAFAIIRLTYYSFGTDFIRGTWAQYVVMTVVIITIVYGCSRALKETHLKRRLAYSTISNLSYILFGVTIMTPLGLVGALTHMVFHAVMKICSFFCAGAIIHQTERNYIHELDGLGRKMPMVFGIFTVSALGLMGVPGLAGFISKWNLTYAAVESGNSLAYVGVGALLVSALLTAIYMLTISVRGFFPEKEESEAAKRTEFLPEQGAREPVAETDLDRTETITDPDWKMMVPLFVFAAAILYFGLHSAPLLEFFTGIALGMNL